LLDDILVSSQTEFLRTYATIGSEIAAYGGPDWSGVTPGNNDGRYGSQINREEKKGSPVVPESHNKVCEEGEFVMYSVLVIRGQYQAGNYEGDTFVPGSEITRPIFLRSFTDNSVGLFIFSCMMMTVHKQTFTFDSLLCSILIFSYRVPLRYFVVRQLRQLR
jgi:hypothetical protein